MDQAVYDAVASLAIRDVPRWSPRQAGDWLNGAASSLAGRDRALVEAAIALRAGRLAAVESAVAALGSDPLAETFRVAAQVIGRNRFPGQRGALLEDGDLGHLREAPAPSTEPPPDAALMIAVGHVDAMVPNWRSVTRDGGADGARMALARAGQLRAVVAGAAPWLATALALIEADLHRLAGDGPSAEAAWTSAHAEAEAAGDALGLAALYVARGDWQAAPRSSPEVLDLTIDLSPDRPTPPPDPAAARVAYDAAAAIYARHGCELGRAALALRAGHLAAATGDGAGWRAAAVDAEALARQCDDEWLTLLAATHGALASITLGATVPEAELAAEAARVTAAGGRAWARGLVRFVVAYSSRLREAGDFVPARRSLRLARAMAERTGAPREVVDVTDRLLELYGRMSFPAPRAVLELATVDHGIDALDAAADPVGWYAMCNRAVSAMGMATQVADGALVVAAGRLVERVAAAGPSEPDPMAQMLMAMLRSSAAQAHVLGPLYAARAARRDGDPDRAAPLEREALAAADAMGPDGSLLRAVVLGTLGRTEEALTIVEQLREQLPPDQLRLLYIRLGATDRAVWTLPPVDPPSDRPWEAWSHRAQIYAGEERWQEAADAADAGIEAFETTLTRYARDALKTSATEDLDAADMYLARILADLPAAIRGDATAVRRAFGTSDRARSISNVERIGSERSEPDVRRWLALGSRWAAAYEGLSSRAADVASIDVDATRRQLRAVEDDLDEAEDAMLGAHPELLELLRSRRPPLDVGAVARALPDAALLLQFHCWNDELVSWALTTDRCTIHRVRVDAKSVASDGRRFLRACAGRSERESESALVASLSELLLGPWSDLLDQHERVVLVPHAALTGVPLHLLEVGGAMLADRHVVSYAPSSSHLLTLADGRAPGSSGRAAVVGDPAYAPDRGLSRLAGSGVEARAVASTLGAGPALTGAEATREAVLAQGAGATVVHLGTHGVLDERAPNRSFLALAGTDALTPADLFGVDIDGSMVVMSACNSGRGTATAGGDVVGLTRAVLASGAGSVVASLWPVGDEAGCLIMSGFYEHLVGSESRPPVSAAWALHRAAADVRAMSRGDRRDAYQELAERVGAEGAPAGVRDAGATEAGAPGVAPDESTAVAAWAPFVYVGR